MDGNNNAIHMVANPHNGLELRTSNKNQLVISIGKIPFTITSTDSQIVMMHKFNVIYQNIALACQTAGHDPLEVLNYPRQLERRQFALATQCPTLLTIQDLLNQLAALQRRYPSAAANQKLQLENQISLLSDHILAVKEDSLLSVH